MFAENISGNVLKYDTVCQFSKIFIKIFERTFQSVAGEDKLGKCSFKYFDIWREIVFEMVRKIMFFFFRRTSHNNFRICCPVSLS